VEKTKEGYYPDTETFTPTSGETNYFTLRRLDKKYSNELSLYYSFQDYSDINGRALRGGGGGIGFRHYLKPDYVFIGPDFKFAILPDKNIYQSPVDFSWSATNMTRYDFSLNIGTYLFVPYQHILRMGIASGFGLMISLIETKSATGTGRPGKADFYLNAGSPFIDINIRPWTIFIQGDIRVAFGKTAAAYYDFGELLDNFPLSVGVRKKW
jgi:hypothetical protein